MERHIGRWAVVVLGIGLAGSRAAAAGWGEFVLGGAPVASLSAVSSAVLSPSRLLLAGVREDQGVARIYLAGSEAGSWAVLNGGQPADGEVYTGPVRSPVLAGDGAGHAYLVFARHDGVSGWRIHGRMFDGVAVSDLDGGQPADAETPGGTVNQFAAVAVDGGELHVLYSQFDGSRMALRGAWYAGANWQQANDGLPVDLGGSGWTDAPAVAGDGAGGAVAAYTQETPAGRRLFALRLTGPWLGRTWERLDGGLPLDRADLGNVSAPAVTVLGDGRILAAFLQEDADGITRLFAVIRDGMAWSRLNDGAPLDTGPAGVGDLAVAVTASGGAVIAYATLAGDEPSRVYALEVQGGTVVPMNGGAALEAPGGGLTGLDLAPGWLLSEQGGAVYARALAAAAAPAAAVNPAPAAAVDGLTVTRAVFRPGRGERAGLSWTAVAPQQVRVSIHSIAGELVSVLADGSLTGRAGVDWDGRDAAGRNVAPGVYMVRARGESFRESRKLVVVR